MKTTIEKMAILSLSLVLTSMLAVSANIPILIEQFSTYSRSSIETLISVPALPMIIMVALSPVLSNVLSERLTIIIGLLLVGVAGAAPSILTNFNLIFISRILLGIGIGLINTRAISIIGERWQGSERSTLLGFRGSAETLGQTLMTLVAGQLLAINWKYSFYVYLIALPILAMYLMLVPTQNLKIEGKIEKEMNKKDDEKMTKENKQTILLNASLITFLICINVSNALRIPSLVVEKGYGTDVTASRLLSIMVFAGFVGGLVFGKLMQQFNRKLIVMMLFILAGGLLLVGASNQLILSGVAIGTTGFSAAVCVTWVFNNLSEELPRKFLNIGMAIVLVGCNSGAFIAPFVMQAIRLINPSLATPFFCYGTLLVLVASSLLFFYSKKLKM